MYQSIVILIIGFVLLALFSCYYENFTTVHPVSITKTIHDKTHPAAMIQENTAFETDFKNIIKYFSNKYSKKHPASETSHEYKTQPEIEISTSEKLQEYKTKSEINSEMIKHQEDIHNLVLPKLSNDLTFLENIDDPYEFLFKKTVSAHPSKFHEFCQNNYPDLISPLNKRDFDIHYYSPKI